MSDAGVCCAPSRGGEGETRTVEASERPPTKEGMVEIPGGTFWMGSDDSSDSSTGNVGFRCVRDGSSYRLRLK